MVQQKSRVLIIDNSVAYEGICLNVLKKKYGTVGCVIVLSLAKVKFDNKIKSGQVFKGLIVCTKKFEKLLNGFSVSFKFNSVILVKSSNQFGSKKGSVASKKAISYQPIGTRIRGYISSNLRLYGYSKIVSISWGCF